MLTSIASSMRPVLSAVHTFSSEAPLGHSRLATVVQAAMFIPGAYDAIKWCLDPFIEDFFSQSVIQKISSVEKAFFHNWVYGVNREPSLSERVAGPVALLDHYSTFFSASVMASLLGNHIARLSGISLRCISDRALSKMLFSSSLPTCAFGVLSETVPEWLSPACKKIESVGMVLTVALYVLRSANPKYAPCLHMQMFMLGCASVVMKLGQAVINRTLSMPNYYQPSYVLNSNRIHHLNCILVFSQIARKLLKR